MPRPHFRIQADARCRPMGETECQQYAQRCYRAIARNNEWTDLEEDRVHFNFEFETILLQAIKQAAQ